MGFPRHGVASEFSSVIYPLFRPEISTPPFRVFRFLKNIRSNPVFLSLIFRYCPGSLPLLTSSRNTKKTFPKTVQTPKYLTHLNLIKGKRITPPDPMPRDAPLKTAERIQARCLWRWKCNEGRNSPATPRGLRHTSLFGRAEDDAEDGRQSGPHGLPHSPLKLYSILPDTKTFIFPAPASTTNAVAAVSFMPPFKKFHCIC